jgi:uncharacterized protein (TIGR02147 family)
MNELSIYNYSDPRLYLLDTLAVKQKQDKDYSARKWSKDMGLKSHSLLLMILQGKRDLRIQHCDFIGKGVDLDANEFSYFQTLVQFQNAKSLREKDLIASQLIELNPGEGFKSTKVCEFKIISDWVHMAIMAMTDLKDFKGTEEQVAVALRGKVSLSEIRSAIVRLMDMKLLVWNDDGTISATCNRLSTSDDVSNEGAKEYHRQVLDLAKEAIDEQSLEEREFQSFTMAVSKEKISLAKEMIRKFRAKLSKAVSGEGDYVYQTNIQFFQLTKGPSSNVEDNSVAQDDFRTGEKL